MFSLRPMTDDDLMMVLEWRNHPNVREHMFNSHVISEAEHRAYFARVERDPSKQYLICLDEDAVPVGAVNFVEIDEAHRTAFWGFYSGDRSRRGIGTQMGYLALNHAFENLGIRKLNAEVLASNPVGLSFHERLGFQVEGVFKKHRMAGDGYVDIYRIALFRDAWQSKWRIVTVDRMGKAAGGKE